MYRTIAALSVLCLWPRFANAQVNAGGPADGFPADAKYACPMETHPDEAEPSARGPYFSAAPGRCPLCGMELKPLGELAWVRLRQTAGGSPVAYTCPRHQHVFSEKPGECPRCGQKLQPFKVMYTCPDPKHAGVIRTEPGNCPQCGRGLVAFRGVWLDEEMAAANVPPHSGPAETSAYHCPVHPLVHSDEAGHCTICGEPLEANEQVAESGTPLAAPEGGAYLCPMHPDTQRSDAPGTCNICGMQLVAVSDFKRPHGAPAQIAAQINYITEHYLELQRLLASDKTTGIALQALGIAAASEELLKHIDDPGIDVSSELRPAVEKMRAAALKTTGTSLGEDRVTFVELSTVMHALIDQARPDAQRWPKLYIFHCPMSKGDWVQATLEKANPYYGFQMLKCGELREVK